MEQSILILDIGLMAILVCVALMIVRMRSLFAIVMLQGVYSLICAAWFVSLDAVDVAFTEAAVGAGVSTVLMLSAMLLADRQSKPVPITRQFGPLIVCIVAGAAMFYAVGDMPAFGDANSPANSYVGMDYIEMTAKDIHIPNIVTAVLASYRGFDTFGETVVIFAAGLGVLLLLGLNGNAGRWRARPNGIELSGARAPVVKAPSPEAKPSARPTAANQIKKPTAKKSSAKKSSAKKAPAKKAPAKKAPAKKAPAKKAPAKKPAAKKASSAKKSTSAKKSVSPKTAAKAKSASKSTAKRKPAAKSSRSKSKSGGAS